MRSHTDLTVSPDRNPPFMLLKDGSIRNAYTLRLRNMESRPRRMEVALSDLPGAVFWTDTIGRDGAARSQTFAVPADEVLTVRAYVMAPSGTTARDFSFDLTSLDEQRESDRSETRFSAPGDQP